MLVAYRVSVKRHYPREPRASLLDILKALIKAFWGLMAPVILLGAMYSGICTPTEAAVIAATYILVIELFVYKDLSIKQLPPIMAETALQLGTIMIIFAAAYFLSWIMGREGIPEMIATAALGISENKVLLLSAIVALVLILGCFMEGLSIMIILLPVLIPLVTHLKVDLIHFGMIMCLGVTLGVITPPFGMVLFFLIGVIGESMASIVKELIPFIVVLVAVLVLITFIPPISLFLPQLLFK